MGRRQGQELAPNAHKKDGWFASEEKKVVLWGLEKKRVFKKGKRPLPKGDLGWKKKEVFYSLFRRIVRKRKERSW